MSDKGTRQEQVVEVDMNQLLNVVWHGKWLIIIAAIICAVVSYVGTKVLTTPLYQTSVMFYVNNARFSLDGTMSRLSWDDIRVSKKMVDTYAVILNSKTTLDAVLDHSGVDADKDALHDGLNVTDRLDWERVDETEVFRVYVTWDDPEECEKIATAIAEVLPGRIDEIIVDTSARIVDYAVVPRGTVFPNLRNSLILGGLLGVVLSAGIMVLRYLFDNRIKTASDLSRYGDIPLLAAIPDLEKQK